MGEVTLMLSSTGRDGCFASGQLLPMVYEELRNLAAMRMARETTGQTLQPTELVHEAWLRLAGKEERNWNDRVHFFRAAAQAMRRILVDRARRKASLRGRGTAAMVDFAGLDVAAITPDERLLLIDESLERLEHEDPESARIVMLKFFAGLTNEDVARTLGVNVRTIERRWVYAKTSLFQMIRSEMKDPA
jgi:RNA polymerase sigma factor (TIGR02999 family)